MAVPRRSETVAGDKDAVESCRWVRNHHHGECAVDLASSCCTYAPPATTATAASSTSRKKRPRVVVADETTTTMFFRSDATTDVDDDDDPASLLRRRRRERWKQGLEAVKTAVAWRLAAKDDEIRRTRREMVERLRCACAVSRTWQDIAMAREGEKAVLRSENAALRVELDHVLRAKPRWHDDAESCCHDDNFTTTGGKEEDEGGGGGDTSTAARCFGCGERACCWHLCAACAAAAWACPACGYANMDDVHVNYYMV
uniref:RING-type domain-containing protein n=1 Tax=Oryza punctata TaxID=4537 RepID=A0A0E0MPX1_ORYPU